MLDRSKITAEECAETLARFRERRPHVHCITNAVAQNLTANVLLAAGASPSMTVAPDEIEDFVGFADALLVNLGTMDDERRTAARIGVDVAGRLGKPWVLDPVFAQVSTGRLALANELLARSPALVRANEMERRALELSPETLVAITGERDRVSCGTRMASISNGSAVMTRVTAMGCALTALAAGFLAVGDDPFVCAVSALTFFGLAGERAAELSSGPGTFQPHLLDALANLTPEDIQREARLS